MKRGLVMVTATGVALTGVLAGGAVTASTPTYAGNPSHVTQAVSSSFPDPGFAKFGDKYYLYSTGDGFPAAVSSKAQATYARKGATAPLGNWPSWNAPAPRFGRHHWAPEVFKVSKDGKALYVMYFTAWNVADGWNNDCIGIATSVSPTGRFKYTGQRICTAKGYEAIDPTMVKAGDKRYLVYKKGRYGSNRYFGIVSVPVDAATGTRVIKGVRTRLASTTASETMEAPSFVRRGGYWWMFVSRGAFDGNKYRTEVWRSPVFNREDGFKKVKNLVMNNPKGQPFLSPGGASVLQDGNTTRIAFHATLAGTSKRQAYVGVIKWNSAGEPYLY